MGFERVNESKAVLRASRNPFNGSAARGALWLILLLSIVLSGRSSVGQELEVSPSVAVPEVAAGVISNEDAKAELTALEHRAPESVDSQLRSRLICYAFFGGVLLVFLALLFGYLRLNHATRGFHSGRLQLAALVLSGVVVVVGYLLWAYVLFK